MIVGNYDDAIVENKGSFLSIARLVRLLVSKFILNSLILPRFRANALLAPQNM